MADRTESLRAVRYVYDEHEAFFVDMTKPDEDGQGEELLTEEVLALLNSHAAALARLETAERFVRAHDAVVAGVLDFDLQHAAVEELEAARRGVDWIVPPALVAQKEKPDADPAANA